MAESEEFMYSTVRQNAYDGAVTNYRMEQVGLISGDSDTLAARELKLLWQRNAHALRNNGWAKSARLKHKTNVGVIKVKWKDANGVPNKEMQELWDVFAKNPNLDGFGTLENTQDEWLGNLFDGEAICRMIVKKRKDSKIPLVLQNIPKEYLDPCYADSGKNIKNSITFTDSGIPTTYNFSKKLTKLLDSLDYSGEKVEVPADEILHIFERMESGQWRGIPFLAVVLLSLYSLDDLSDATIQKQVNAQHVTWIIKNTSMTSAVATGTGRSSIDPNDIDPSTGKPKKIIQGSGGGTQYLNKNEDLFPVQGQGVGAELIDLMKFELHKIAEACGLTYELLTGDVGGVSLATLQHLNIELKIRAEHILNLYIINLGLNKLCEKFKTLAGIYVSEALTELKPVYQLPRRYSTNELKDAQADLLELKSNLGLFSAKLEERGISIEEFEEDRELMKRLDVDFSAKKENTDPQSGNVEANSNTRG